MEKLAFPQYEFRVKIQDGKPLIFDVYRKKWVSRTPEEWVRQHLARYLTEEKQYPAALLAIEKSITVNGLKKRCDILACDRQGRPLLLAECKAPEVEITQAVFDQAARYNMTTGVEILVLSNGLRHYCCRIDHAAQSYRFLPEIPVFGTFDGTKHLP